MSASEPLHESAADAPASFRSEAVLEAVLKKTAAIGDHDLGPETWAQLQEVARRRNREREPSDEAILELLAVLVSDALEPLPRRFSPTWKAHLTEAIAEAITVDPAARPRLERLWSHLQEGGQS